MYERQKNEIEQQFAQHNLAKDMAEAHEKASRPVSAGHVRWLKLGNLALLVVLLLLVGWLCFVLGVF